jgi:hypothetical protein
MLRTIRLVILLVVGIPVLALIAWSALSTWLTGQGTLVFVAPEDSGLRVALDDRSPSTIAPGGHQSFRVKQGTHRIELMSRDGRVERNVKVSSGFAELLIGADHQCFALLDVSRSHYHSGEKSDALPKVKRRIKADDAYDLPSHTFFGEGDLPRSIGENESCNLVLESACEDLALDDDQLLTALGYRP